MCTVSMAGCVIIAVRKNYACVENSSLPMQIETAQRIHLGSVRERRENVFRACMV